MNMYKFLKKERQASAKFKQIEPTDW